MQPPLIGIPCRHDTSPTYMNEPLNVQSDAYLKAISEAEGIPLLIPLNLPDTALRRLYELTDGILLSGGGDIDPPLYGQNEHPSLSDVQPDRDDMEMKISRWAAEDGKPLLAICRGIQVLAVAHGGTLCQDIPSQMPDAKLHHYHYLGDGEPPVDQFVHEARFASSSRLADMLQTDCLPVNSLHHQAVLTAPAPLQIVGRSNDGIIEALELPQHPFYIGVQWHPELLTHKQDAARQIFQAFVQACRS
jgi:putative glutamine amidotransferase